MIPLAAPIGYWEQLHLLISKFIWKGKRPCLKLTILHEDKTRLLETNQGESFATSQIAGPSVFQHTLYFILTCRPVMKHVRADLKWYNHLPNFNSLSLLTGNITFSFPTLEE